MVLQHDDADVPPGARPGGLRGGVLQGMPRGVFRADPCQLQDDGEVRRGGQVPRGIWESGGSVRVAGGDQGVIIGHWVL